MKKLTILCVMALLCLNFWANAQEIKALKVGDKLPAEFWNRNHQIYENAKVFKQALMPLKGKLLVIDFWASWCSNCINKFRAVEELQKEFKDDASFLLVNTQDTRDSLYQVDALFSGSKYKSEPYKLTSVFEDTYIHQLFPYGYLPYYVIISPSGEVRAIVPGELITSANIKLMVDAYAKKTKKGAGHE